MPLWPSTLLADPSLDAELVAGRAGTDLAHGRRLAFGRALELLGRGPG
jgi:hypothetical protein